jgi:5-(aminomethyl)-3-furanmethanol phosphate kinase
MNERAIVVKVGGSLLRAESVVDRLRRWVNLQAPRRLVLMTGGGPFPKELRLKGDMDEDVAHWVAIRMMTFHTRGLCKQYGGGVMVSLWPNAQETWELCGQPFFNAGPYLRADDANPDHLPHSWDVTSDSIAAHLAARHDADLVMLKACPVTAGPYNWTELSRQGIVDAWFPRIAERVANITLANLPE